MDWRDFRKSGHWPTLLAAFLYFANHGGLPEGVDSWTAMPRYLGILLSDAGIIGFLGLMIATMLAAEMSTDSGYLLTWATVIYNDLINPVLKRPLSPNARLTTVRLLVLAIGVFLVLIVVSVAMLSHSTQGSAVLGAPMMKFVPIFVAGMVLLIRVLLINTFSIAGENLFSVADDRYSSSYRPSYRQANETYSAPMNSSLPRPAPKPTPAVSTRPLYSEPTYHPVGMNAQERVENPSMRR